ncbi:MULTISPECIES: hypothetical protein [Bacillus subtilis group]|nr:MULTISPECIES: hypothetical protein [Bacillus subtilis group]MCY1628318.1 hypothetical protein [Bacillus paralicheniformis]QAS18709.1 hypothetical protein EQJ69_22560 [Bacillus licheniformis]
MNKTRFCFRITEGVGMAQDKQGNNECCYCEIKLEPEQDINNEQYERIHLEYREGLAKHLGVEAALIEPITNKEYDDQQ